MKYSIYFLILLFLPGICTAAPSLVYSTMVADSTVYYEFNNYYYQTGWYAADADENGNLYIAAPVAIPYDSTTRGKAIRIYRVNVNGTDVDTVADLPGYEFCRTLSCRESGIYVLLESVGTGGEQIVRISPEGSILFITSKEFTLPSIDRHFIDQAGNLYITYRLDSERSEQFPVTPGAVDPDYNGGIDIGIQKYDPNGNLLYSSFLGGPEDDLVMGLSVNEQGTWYLYLDHVSPHFPYPFDGDYPTGGSVFGTVLVSPSFDDIHGYYRKNYIYFRNNIFHDDVFYDLIDDKLTKYTSLGDPIWSMDLGGGLPMRDQNDGTLELAYSFSLDDQDRIYVVRRIIDSTPFTTTPDALYPEHISFYDLGIWQITEDAELLYGTYFGGLWEEETARRAVAFRDGKLYVAGFTNSLDFPLTPGSYTDTRAHGYWGLFAFCIDFSGQTVAVDDDAAPAPLILDPPYPNPFNPQTTISFTLPEAGFARLAVYDISGQLVRELTAEMLPAGRHEIVWDGRDAAGMAVGSGVYIARLTAGEHVAVRKVTLVR